MKKLLAVTLHALVLACGVMVNGAIANDLEKGLQRELRDSRTVIIQAATKLRNGASPAREISRLKSITEDIRASHLLMQERFKEQREKASALGAKAVERQNAVATEYGKAIDDFLALIDALPPEGTVSQATLDALTALIDRIIPRKTRPLLGTLPYKHLGYPAREPATDPTIVPAYRGGNRTVSVADTASSAEAPISAEITALAQSLQWNPVLIYEWVKNNVETEWYWGVMKGAEETLRQRSGNDADQAALLVSLLRASGFPARFVKGTIEFFPGIDKVKNLTGIDDPLRIAAFFQKAGIPFKPVIAGGGIANFQVEHIWVESEIPYSNYRGAVIDDFGKTWLGLDTSIKPAGYTRNTPLDIPDTITASVRDDYLQGFQEQTPLEFLRGRAGVYLDANQQGKSWQDLLASRTLNPDVLKILPSSMQFKQIAVTGEYTVLPAELKHTVKFTATGGGNELYGIALDAMALSNRKIILTYEPETIEDQRIIDSYGGLDNTPSYFVRLRPALTVDGERLVVASDGLPMGGDYTLTIDVVTPNGTETVNSLHIAGNLAVIGIVSQNVLSPASLTDTDDAQAILFKEAIGYIDRWNKAEDELAAFLKVAIARPVPTVVTVGGIIDVTWLLDIPHGFEWKGVFVDAALRGNEVVTQTGDPGREKAFMRLSALQGSILENRIFEDELKVESVSTAKLLQVAAVNGTQILTIDKNNIDALLPTLPFDDAVKQDIANAVNQNLTVKIPQAEIAYKDWTGIGYLKENRETGESGWMLSGQVAGGMTAWRVDLWPDAYAGVLQNANSEPPVYDPSSAKFIAKITGSEFQRGEAGSPLPQPLQVRVTDSKGRPVTGVEVTFTIKAGEGSFAGNSQILTATTNVNGIASAPMILGRYTKDNPTSFWQPGDEHSQQVGENIIDAALPSGVGLSVPFSVYGFPGKPVKMKPTYGDALWGTILAFGSFVAVVLEDEYGNPISNVPVEFKVADPVGAPGCATQTASVAQKSYLVKTGLACLNNAPVWGECGDTSQQSLTVTTGTYGAPAQIIMGGMPGALYKITAVCKDQQNPAACIDPATNNPFTVTFNRYTNMFGSCSAGSDPARQLFLDSVMVTDENGRNINAGRAGETISLRAKLFYLREGETESNVSLNCDGSVLTCSKITGSGGYSIDTINPGDNSLNVASVNFDDLPGTRLADTADAKGIYTADYVLKPGLNQVVITGTGTIGVKSTTMACPATCATSQNAPYTGSAAKLVELYGVGIQVQNIPTLQINQSGALLEDLTVSYTIDPPEYRAGTAHVVVFRQDEPVAYIPSETSGQGSATLAKGFRFDMQSSYAVEVILNLGTGIEIRSGKIPVNLVGGGFAVERQHLLAQFDGSVPAGTDWTEIDNYKIFNFILKRPASVKVVLLDTDFNQRAVIVPQTTLPAGNHNFALDYGLVQNAGFSPGSSPRFYLQVLYAPSDGNPPYMRLYPGKMIERTTGRMLGQVIVHDVLIQDGSLNLTRQDVAFKGRGPQFVFTRSYNNQDSPLGPKPLGEGWSHSLDMELRPLSSQASGAGPIPDWVKPLKGLFFGDGSIPQATQAWTSVQVNGATFRKSGGRWYAERGRHGTLEETAAGFVYTAKDGTRYRYDYPTIGATPVRTMEDRNGNVMTFAYDPAGHLSSVTDAVGRRCDFTYGVLAGVFTDDSSRLTGISCPDGVELIFAYNPQGYLQSVRRGARVESYDYAPEQVSVNADYNLVRTTDSNNHSYGYEYNQPGAINANLANFVKFFKSQDVVKKVTYPDLNFATFAYDVLTGNKRTVTDLRHNDTVYTLNYYGNPTRIDEPLGKTTKMTWSIDEQKNDNVMTSKTDPLNNSTFYEYDPQGNVNKETDPYGNFVTTTWNQKYSLPELRIDRNGVTERWNYDPANGNLLWHEDGDQKRINYSHYPTGEVRTKTDPRQNMTDYTYDPWGNPETVKEPEGSLTRFVFDIRGRRTALIDPNNRRTDYGYDPLDYPASVTSPAHASYALPDGSTNVKTTVYDPEGNLLTETDRVGLTLTYTYTERNQVRTITRNIDAGKKTFGYDENGNLKSETDWKGAPTAHTYDELSRRRTTINRLNHAMSMDYDLAGNLKEVKDYEGRITTNEYDKLNRLTDTLQPALEGEQRGHVNYTYYNEADPKTNLKTETDQEGHTAAYEYNGRYLRKKRINALTHTYVWDYDDAGNLERETDEEGHFVRYGYDRQNRRIADIRVHEGAEVTTSFVYDPAGNRTHVIDPLQRDTETRYDEWNRPWQLITPPDPVNYVTTSELDGEGREVRSIDGNGHERKKLRGKRGLVLTATDAEEHDTTYTYDLNGNVETVTDANHVLTRTGYDAEDRKTFTTEAEGTPDERKTEILLRDKVGNPLQVKDYNGNVTVTTYNPLNLPWRVYDPAPFDGHYSETAYYKTGKVKSVTNRRGKVTGYEYDELNRLKKVTDPLQQTVETTYDKVGNVKTVKDKRNILSENFYDEQNRLTERRRAGIRLVTNEYDAVGNLRFITDAENHKTENTYTSRNLLDATIFPDTHTQRRSYDGVGNLLTLTDEEEKVTTYTYDKENRQRTVELAGETTEKSYDAVGSLVSIIKPKGNSRSMEYDKLRRLAKVTDDPGGFSIVTRYEYDKNGNLRHQYDPRDNHVEYTWDELNRKKEHIQHKAAGNLVTRYTEYDEEGNLKRLVDPKGQEFSYAYDDLNRQSDAFYPATTTPYLALQKVHTEYDPNNNVKVVVETKAGSTGTVTDTTTNDYDDFDRLKTSNQRGTIVSYGYDHNGNRTSVGTISGSTTYTFDSRNWLRTATVGSSTTNFDYYPDGKKKTVSYPNSAGIAYTYYPTNRVKTVTNTSDGAVISDYAYEYDENGNRKKQTELQSGKTATTDYGYDTLDRLTSFTVTNGADSTTTSYDSFVGYNRGSEKVVKNGAVITAKTYHYDETDWLTSIDDTGDPANPETITYGYDNNSNTIRKADSSDPGNDTVFDYDSANRLVRAVQGTTLLGLYDYNAQGMRVRHRNSERGDVDYFYDGRSVIEEKSPSGSLLAHYNYAEKLMSLITPSGSQFYHLDGLGSTVNLTDGQGKVQTSYFLNPWGMILDQIGESVNRHVFTGKEEDENTGLIYFGARYYDPDTGRFITQDNYLGKQTAPPSLHRYLYAYSNPLAYIDPDGHAGYFFDGTANHLRDTNYDGSENVRTNVAKLFEAYGEKDKFYAYGIGSGFQPDGTPYEKKWHGGNGRKITYEQITGESMDARVAFMIKNLEGQLKKGDKIVDVYAFSRGSATGLEFLNRIQDEIKNGNDLYKDINIRFVGLFDVVPSKRSGLLSYSDEEQVATGEKDWFGFDKTKPVKYRFNLPKDMKFSAKPIHTVSIDEQRKEFATVDLEGALQVGFRGVHADVGGGYEKNHFDWIALDYMVEQSKAAGVKFKDKELKRIERNGYEQYREWLNTNSPEKRSDAQPHDNSEWYYNDHEPRKLPNDMLLHPSVDYFQTAPKNDIGRYRYLQ